VCSVVGAILREGFLVASSVEAIFLAVCRDLHASSKFEVVYGVN